MRVSPVAPARAVVGARYQSMRSVRLREALAGYLFILPTMLGFTIFVLGPMFYSLGLSTFEWDVLTPARFVGLHNYQALLKDVRFVIAFKNVLIFVAFVVSLNLVVSLTLAVALQWKMPTILRYFYRTSFFIPVVTSMASIAIVLGYLFHKELGIINYYLSFVGIDKIPWLASTRWAMISVVLATVWKSFGFDLILFVAGINNIPRHLYEAAEIDGASGWSKFWNITIPLLSPTIFFAVVVGLIGGFQVFDQAYVMTRGGPGDATRTVVMILYEDAFGSLRFGYGSAAALVLFALIMILTAFQFRYGQRLVHYE
jgi:multiple sugar transport system permease protein